MNDPAAPKPTGLHLRLRADTADGHAMVDEAFGRFDLGNRGDYAAFLVSHGRVLPAIEDVLTASTMVPPFVPRAAALTEDLAVLGAELPEAMPVPSPTTCGEAWGMFYVIEGSRLGGVMLARAVPPAFPRAYLSAAHGRGGWRSLLQALDAAGAAGGAKFEQEVFASARATFDLYALAARSAGKR